MTPYFRSLAEGEGGVSVGGFLDHLCIFSFSKQPFLLKITTLLTSVRTQSHCIQKQGSECGVPGVSLGAHGVRNPEEFIRGLQKQQLILRSAVSHFFQNSLQVTEKLPAADIHHERRFLNGHLVLGGQRGPFEQR